MTFVRPILMRVHLSDVGAPLPPRSLALSVMLIPEGIRIKTQADSLQGTRGLVRPWVAGLAVWSAG